MAATNRAKAQAAVRNISRSAGSVRKTPGEMLLHADAANAPQDRPSVDLPFLHSRPLIAPEGTFAEAVDWSKLTVGGKPIPEHLHGLVAYAATDQGRQEREAARIHEPSGLEFVADANDKLLKKYADGAKDDIEPWANPDPLTEVAARHTDPDETARFLSPRLIDNNGLRGWQPKLIEKNGIKQNVTVNGMILATMPKDRKKKRDAHFANLAETAMVKATDAEREQTERAISLTLGRKHRGVDKGFESFRGDPAAMEDRDFAIPGLDRATV